MAKTVRMITGYCEICGRMGKVWESSDCHKTGCICPACADKEGYELCRACGDMRAPENLVKLDPARFTQHGKYCPGCAEWVEEGME